MKKMILYAIVMIFIISLVSCDNRSEKNNGDTEAYNEDTTEVTTEETQTDSSPNLESEYVCYLLYKFDNTNILDVYTLNLSDPENPLLYAMRYNPAQYGHPQIQFDGNYYNDGYQLYSKKMSKNSFTNEILELTTSDNETIILEYKDGKLLVVKSDIGDLPPEALFVKK